MFLVFWCTGLLMLLLVSEPLSVTFEERRGLRIFIRFVFFGMILTHAGHTEERKHAGKKGTRRETSAKRRRRRALMRALRYLLPRTSITLEYPASTGISPFVRGTHAAVLGALYALAASHVERAELHESRERPLISKGRATVRLSFIHALIASVLFAFAYIKRKDTAWQSTT